jgi:hypothetical protein
MRNRRGEEKVEVEAEVRVGVEVELEVGVEFLKSEFEHKIAIFRSRLIIGREGEVGATEYSVWSVVYITRLTDRRNQYVDGI